MKNLLTFLIVWHIQEFNIYNFTDLLSLARYLKE